MGRFLGAKKCLSPRERQKSSNLEPRKESNGLWVGGIDEWRVLSTRKEDLSEKLAFEG